MTHTSTTRPAPCRYDRTLTMRVTRDHRDDCLNPADHRGCAPCTAPHCVVCNRTHTTNDTPATCPACTALIRDDLTTVTHAYADLAHEATDAAHDGRLAAAAPIPGGTATVLRAPSVPAGELIWTPVLDDDHPRDKHGRPVDPLPPIAVLTWWEDAYRAHLNLATRAHASVPSSVAFFTSHLTALAQDLTGPDWVAFTREVRALRSMLEHALHNEQTPERGVECFECGDELVRRFRDPARCTHHTPARRELAWWLRLGYPEAVPASLVREARRPCGRCDQGGIKDPTVGLSWECPGCRREYTAGEYATAVRRDLLEGGPDRDGWTHVSMAAEAATLMTRLQFTPQRVRQWASRGLVASKLSDTGITLVLWSDVRDQVEAAVERHGRMLAEREREAGQEAALRGAVAAGRDPEVAGAELGIHPRRVEKFVASWASAARMEAS